ncbi:LysR substrate binding domain protein [compost metagenome]
MRGCGLFFAPSVLVNEDIEAGRLVQVMGDFQGVEFTMNAMFPSRNHLPTKVRLFVDLMVNRFA